MTAVLGFVLPHDDSVNDRSEGSKLSNADDVTRELWHKAYGVSFGRPGSMYRGAPPKVSQPANRWDCQSVQQKDNVHVCSLGSNGLVLNFGIAHCGYVKKDMNITPFL